MKRTSELLPERTPAKCCDLDLRLQGFSKAGKTTRLWQCTDSSRHTHPYGRLGIWGGVTVFSCFPEKPHLHQGLVCGNGGSQTEPHDIRARPCCSPMMGQGSLGTPWRQQDPGRTPCYAGVQPRHYSSSSPFPALNETHTPSMVEKTRENQGSLLNWWNANEQRRFCFPEDIISISNYYT